VELLDEFGAEAYLVFFGVIEIYSREFSPENEWKLDVTLPFFHRKLHTSPSKIKKILSKITKWEVEYKDNRVIIFIPKFKELLDNWTTRQLPKENESLRSKDVETTQPIRIKNKEERIKNKEADNIIPVDNSKDAFLKELKEAILKTTEIYNSFQEQQQITNFVKSNIRSGNKKAILHCINSLLKSKEKIVKPQAYLESAFRVENGKHNSADSESKSNEYKKNDLTGFGAILKNISEKA